MSAWLCNTCDVGVLDPDKKVRSIRNGIEFVVMCPNCGQENPTTSFTSDPMLIPLVESFSVENSGPIEPGVKHGSPDTGIAFQSLNYTFVEEGKEVGRFWWDEKNHCLQFEGQLGSSAKIFVRTMQIWFDEWYKEKYG